MRFVRSDVNQDFATDIGDVVVILCVLFIPDTTLPCLDAQDSNDDGQIDLGDAVVILAHLFLSQPIDCLDAADVNDNGELEIADVIYLLNFLFLQQSSPPSPFPGAGLDHTSDTLGCDQ